MSYSKAMSFWDTFRIAVLALRKNKMRAILTVLGVVIGIAAVTTIVSIGEGAHRLVQSEFKTLGTNVILIFPTYDNSGGVRGERQASLSSTDADAIVRDCREVVAASPLVWTGGQVIYGNDNWNAKTMMGVGENYLTVRNWDLEAGSFFGRGDIEASSKVCVIGQTLIKELFRTSNPIGASIRVNSVPFRVIGILDAKGAGLDGSDQDDVLLMPHTTVRKRINGTAFDEVHGIMASAREVSTMGAATSEIKQLLLQRHKIDDEEKADFQVQDTTEIASALTMITGTLTAMLSAIAGISLVVGGVGIMNIMLVSVTERTREIGIRMAIGARGRDILRQFLLESVLLSCLGGLIGLSLGTALSMAAATAINTYKPDLEWPMVISIPAALVAMGFAAAVGMFFGYYPARRASRLDPIDALRYE
ncbi:MAG: ABC transporter permease [Planctomycetota bacterium]